MTKRSFRNSLILTVITALVLTAVQVYYTIQNYQVNKLQFTNEVQASLDASIEQYFADKAKNKIYVLTSSSADTLLRGRSAVSFSTGLQDIDSLLQVARDSGAPSGPAGLTHMWSSDSLKMDTTIELFNISRFTDIRIESARTATNLSDFQSLTQKVMLSISEELVDLGALYSTLEESLQGKELDIDFVLRQDVGGRKTSVGEMESGNYLSREAASTYLGRFHSISIDFENATLLILKDGIIELIISVLLVGLVMGTLIHLYRTIYAQKQLAAIKDDLISNITHEFKTPIATIFSALEGVTSFNQTNDPEKTRRYLSLSTDQLHKLNDMVEKMLETATIDQGKLKLNREDIEVVAWTQSIVEQFQLVEKVKSIRLITDLSSTIIKIDHFHLENAISNLVDNAIKYGGDEIEVRVSKDGGKVIWEVKDNGGNIPKVHREKIFEKLYRIPTGNQHDVKGFGIGLYYAKTIAELHEGQLILEAGNQTTSFRLSI